MVQKAAPRPRGRPRGFDAEAALSQATERFRTAGYSGTSLDDLVAATGLARPSLYAAFGDKRAMYLAALDRVTARMEHGFDRLAEAKLPLGEALALLMRTVVEGYLTGEAGPSGCIAVSTAATSAVEDAEVRARLARFVALEDARVEALLRDRGDLDAPAHAQLITASIHSLSVRARSGTPPAELHRLAQQCVAMVMRLVEG